MVIAPYPLLFEPLLKPKVWGGRSLARLGKRLPDGVMVGESWELADLASSSPGGGGGGQERSIIINGALAGATLSEAMQRWGQGLIGDARRAPDGGFPLLVKLLDAHQNLSVQVHPTESWAADHPGTRAKSECWYVLRAAPGARIWKGLRPGLTGDDLAGLLRSERLTEALLEVPVRPGELHWLPGGTVHALGAGVQLLEVQTSGDTTWRLYDWTREYDRPERPLHHEQALQCASLEPPVPPVRLPEGARCGQLLDGPDFEIEERLLRGGPVRASVDDLRPTILHILEGRVTVQPVGLELTEGTTCLVPAAIGERTLLSASVDPTRLLVIRPAL